MTDAQNAAIGAEGLVRDFPAVRAVDGIDLAVERGQVFGFLGANGSGKTTTIRMLTTLLRPTAGRAYVDGLDVQRDPAQVRRRIGVALQEAGLDDLQTGRELLALQGRLHGVRRGEIDARVDELLAIVDLEDAADRRIGTYSGGMQRRLAGRTDLGPEPLVEACEIAEARAQLVHLRQQAFVDLPRPARAVFPRPLQQLAPLRHRRAVLAPQRPAEERLHYFRSLSHRSPQPPAPRRPWRS